jgi:4-oxalocrotonate tautomerase
VTAGTLAAAAPDPTEESRMPIVTIRVTREGTTPDRASVSAEEKAALIKGASELLRDVLGKPLESTFVVIEEVDPDNWGWGGLPALEYRRQRAAGPSDAGRPA